MRALLSQDINNSLQMVKDDIPDTDSNGRISLSTPVPLDAAAGEEGVGLTARDDDADFECPRNHPLNFLSELLSLDMALRTVCFTREGSSP